MRLEKNAKAIILIILIKIKQTNKQINMNRDKKEVNKGFFGKVSICMICHISLGCKKHSYFTLKHMYIGIHTYIYIYNIYSKCNRVVMLENLF